MAPTKIGTHDGSFHCDEALGCYLLKQTKQFREAEIVRSRDPETLGACDIVIDVGAVYEPENTDLITTTRGRDLRHRFATKLPPRPRVQALRPRDRRHRLGTASPTPGEDLPQGVQVLHRGRGSTTAPTCTTPTRRQVLDNTDSAPEWGRTCVERGQLAATQTTQFTKAVALTGLGAGRGARATLVAPGAETCEQALDTAKEVHPSGEILKLPCYCPWKDHLFELEAERGTSPLPKYALYEDDKGNWRIQAIPLTPSSFENRKPLPAAWRGIRDSALDELSGIEGCIFVHAAGFIGGNKTYEGALAMATKALTMD